MFDIKLPDFSAIERVRTLDIVARWLVGDLIARTDERDPVQLTDAAFVVIHPELGGRRIARGEQSLIDDYRRIRRTIVEPLLGKPAAPPPKRAMSGGYVKHSNGQGLLRYSIREGGPRLEVALRALRGRGKLQIEDHHIDTFQRMANVETGGGVQALNTWDLGVVSIGFFQLTLLHGKLQDLIARAPEAFRRYGIELDGDRRYSIRVRRRTLTPLAIRGAPTHDELRWGDWADRFYRAGLDDDVLVAEVDDGRERLSAGIRTAKANLGAHFDRFWEAYKASLPMRGLYQEALNNLPAGAIKSIQLAAKRSPSVANYYDVLKQTIPEGFAAYNPSFREKGDRLVKKTAMR